MPERPSSAIFAAQCVVLHTEMSKRCAAVAAAVVDSDEACCSKKREQETGDSDHSDRAVTDLRDVQGLQTIERNSSISRRHNGRENAKRPTLSSLGVSLPNNPTVTESRNPGCKLREQNGNR